MTHFGCMWDPLKLQIGLKMAHFGTKTTSKKGFKDAFFQK